MESKSEKWIISAIKSMKSASPTSLKLTLRSIREGRMQELRQCIIREYTIVCHVLQGTISNDLYEWEPAKLELISEDMIHRCFKFEHGNDDWEHLQLPARPNKIKNNIMHSESKL
ncbi:3-hydroxyisobutyryl-CoA hydrolase 1-like [Tripterygium wilfordii]|uniref:3-hydroxyisobutyryl-CoA hydrolase n=1 Tax=Tripterygium wilfordii TaxID=458696 RepID=A0A7J7DUC0_TRIWF|nr:3-hydroxyisobutyryl-CoA hydrolase 1-like [Tripterygium wilfordii]